MADEITKSELDSVVATFLAWEQISRDTIDFKKVYADIAEDLISGLVLSQIIYWHLPNHNGITKLRVQKNGYYWIAKAAKEWFDEIRCTPKQIDRALAILEGQRDPRLGKIPLIETGLYHFNGVPTKHIRLVWENFAPIVNSSILPKGENGFYPKVKMDFDQTSKYYTESTPKITHKKKKSLSDDANASLTEGDADSNTATTKTRINQSLLDAVAIYQGTTPTLGNGFTGTIAGMVAQCWKRELDVSRLSREQYERIARSLPKFKAWQEQKGQTPAQSRDAFERNYAAFVAETVNRQSKRPADEDDGTVTDIDMHVPKGIQR